MTETGKIKDKTMAEQDQANTYKLYKTSIISGDLTDSHNDWTHSINERHNKKDYIIDLKTYTNDTIAISTPCTESLSISDKIEIAKNLVAYAIAMEPANTAGNTEEEQGTGEIGKPPFIIDTVDFQIRSAAETHLDELGYPYDSAQPEKRAQDLNKFGSQINKIKQKAKQVQIKQAVDTAKQKMDNIRKASIAAKLD